VGCLLPPIKYGIRGAAGCSRQDVLSQGRLEAGQLRVAGREIQHGYASSLHDTVRGQIDGLKRAEITPGTPLCANRCWTTAPLGTCQGQGSVEEKQRAKKS
jgi:hypothetical protein